MNSDFEYIKTIEYGGRRIKCYRCINPRGVFLSYLDHKYGSKGISSLNECLDNISAVWKDMNEAGVDTPDGIVELLQSYQRGE